MRSGDGQVEVDPLYLRDSKSLAVFAYCRFNPVIHDLEP